MWHLRCLPSSLLTPTQRHQTEVRRILRQGKMLTDRDVSSKHFFHSFRHFSDKIFFPNLSDCVSTNLTCLATFGLTLKIVGSYFSRRIVYGVDTASSVVLRKQTHPSVLEKWMRAAVRACRSVGKSLPGELLNNPRCCSHRPDCAADVFLLSDDCTPADLIRILSLTHLIFRVERNAICKRNKQSEGW